MAQKIGNADLFSDPPLEFEFDGVAIPSNHSIFKLFPGKTYRLAKAMREASFAFLDIHGLESLPGEPSGWQDEDLLKVISMDRMLRESALHGKKRKARRGSEQDKKRLGYLKNLFFEAKRGDLVLVPLGEGYGSQIAVGEIDSAAGDVRKIEYTSDEEKYSAFGRRVRWLALLERRRLSKELVSSIHSPTAFHLIKDQFREEIYLGAYGTFTFNDIYVAKFDSIKEQFTAQDYANIGVLFNGLAVVHDLSKENETSGEGFYELAVSDESSATIELHRNSPISVVLRTIGPLAWTAAVIFSGSAEGKDTQQLQSVEVEARQVGTAGNKCKIEVPPDVAAAAEGFGINRYKTFCKVRARVETDATVRSPARLKKPSKKTK